MSNPIGYMKEWHRKENLRRPWKRCYENAKKRCENPNCPKYPRYGGRGIKFKLTYENMTKLWYRDEAWKLKCPSIDREDNDGDYTYKNCRFIEMGENSRRAQAEKVIQLSDKNKIIHIWSSQTEAERKGGFKQSKISRAIQMKIKHKNYYWRKV
jgi:hypothetical protein